MAFYDHFNVLNTAIAQFYAFTVDKFAKSAFFTEMFLDYF